MTNIVKTTDIAFRKVDNGQMRVAYGYQGNGTIIGGRLVILRDPITKRFIDKKAKRVQERKLRKAWDKSRTIAI